MDFHIHPRPTPKTSPLLVRGALLDPCSIHPRSIHVARSSLECSEPIMGGTPIESFKRPCGAETRAPRRTDLPSNRLAHNPATTSIENEPATTSVTLRGRGVRVV